MKLLVTGGAGFIGSHIVDLALAATDRITAVAVLDDLSTGHQTNLPESVPLYVHDVRDAQAVRQVFEEFRPDLVSHQAAQASVPLSVRDPLLDASINLMGGLNVLQACVATRVRRVVFASSGGAVYGEVAAGQAVREDEEKFPFSPYATSKLAFELYLQTYRQQYGLESVVLRYGNVFGPRQSPDGEAGVVAIFARRLLRHEPVQIHAAQDGDASGCVRDYVFVADVARANLAAVLGDLKERVYNVGTGEGRATREVAEGLVRALRTGGSTFEAGPYRAGDLHRSVLDAGRLTAEGYAPTPFQVGLEATADWFAERTDLPGEGGQGS